MMNCYAPLGTINLKPTSMKNYKASILFIFTVLFMAFSLIRCESEETRSSGQDLFYEIESKSNFDLTNQIELSRLARVLSKESRAFTILKDATVVSMTDSQGAFRALTVTYQIDGLITTLTVPLAEVSREALESSAGRIDTGGQTRYYVAEPCEMKCTTAWPCSSCTQEIIERCKSQKCTCNSGSDGCSASIVFPS